VSASRVVKGSALDNLTEQLVMESVHKLGKNITVILVAHRLSTIIECDKIFLLVDGRIEAEGDYDDLIQNNGTFQAMAGH
jgi:ABC-type multidrug transport system fused ATPase/permease subunit